jgi:hypothetical protein
MASIGVLPDPGTRPILRVRSDSQEPTSDVQMFGIPMWEAPNFRSTSSQTMVPLLTFNQFELIRFIDFFVPECLARAVELPPSI